MIYKVILPIKNQDCHQQSAAESELPDSANFLTPMHDDQVVNIQVDLSETFWLRCRTVRTAADVFGNILMINVKMKTVC